MTPVPAAGFPKITSVVSRRSSPTARASARWSITAKTLMPFDASRSRSRATVSPTVRGLTLVTTPAGPAPAPPSAPDTDLGSGGPHGTGRVILPQPLGRLPVAQRHADADRDRRGRVVAALGTLDHPRPVGALRHLGVMVLHFRLLDFPLRSPKIAKGAAEGNPYVRTAGHLGKWPGPAPAGARAPPYQGASWASAGRAMM